MYSVGSSGSDPNTGGLRDVTTDGIVSPIYAIPLTKLVLFLASVNVPVLQVLTDEMPTDKMLTDEMLTDEVLTDEVLADRRTPP